jgi:hypothetical protein
VAAPGCLANLAKQLGKPDPLGGLVKRRLEITKQAPRAAFGVPLDASFPSGNGIRRPGPPGGHSGFARMGQPPRGAPPAGDLGGGMYQNPEYTWRFP